MLSAYTCASDQDSIQCEFHSNWIGSPKNLRHEIMGLCSANAYPQTSAQPHCFVDWTVYMQVFHANSSQNSNCTINSCAVFYSLSYWYHPLRTESSYRQHSHYNLSTRIIEFQKLVSDFCENFEKVLGFGVFRVSFFFLHFSRKIKNDRRPKGGDFFDIFL